MSTVKDLTGQRFNRWTVLHRSPERNKHYNVIWTCRCDCGAVRDVLSGNLVRGLSQSCGCFNSEAASTHRMSSTPEYIAWKSAKQRCYNPNAIGYSNYGERGISMCDRWLNSFENFYADMGPRPSDDHSLDRYPNVNGDYEPNNCRWATFQEQQNNKRDNVFHDFGDERITTAEAARMAGVSSPCITKRIAKGMTVNEAISAAPLRQERFFSCFGKTMNIAEWSRETGISDSCLRYRLLVANWTIEKALTTP